MSVLKMKCLLLLFLLAYRAKCMESVYMKRSEIEDQESSASGYAYQLHSGAPLTYAAYPLGGAVGGGVVSNPTNHFAYPPLLGRYTQELPLQLPLSQYKPQTPLGLVPLNYGIQAHPYALHYPLQTQAFRPVPVAVSNSENFVKGGGASYSDANQKSFGEKGSEGYKTAQEYDKGVQGVHDNKDHKEYYSKAGGHKVGHNEEGAHYGTKEEAAKGSQGSHFSQSKSHKKGSKTTGFHRVHHKDEYKKDHSFYDESDQSGHFNKHGDYDSHHSAEKGGFEKGGHEDKGYKVGEQGVKGFVDKGHFNGQNSGFKGEEGKEAHYKNFQEFGKKGEEEQGKQFGYSEKDLNSKII